MHLAAVDLEVRASFIAPRFASGAMASRTGSSSYYFCDNAHVDQGPSTRIGAPSWLPMSLMMGCSCE